MGRKKPTRFDWVRDREEQDTPRVERRSRKDKTEPLDRASELLAAVLQEPRSSWPSLPLPEGMLEMLHHLEGIHPKKRGAIRRQSMLITRTLGEGDLDALAEALGADGGVSQRDEALDRLVRWRSRLLDGDDTDLQAFLEAHPRGDRQRLRALIQQGKRGDDAKRAKVSRQLMAALREAAGIG